MSVGDVVLVSAYLTQLYAPLNFLGFVYREIKHALADMERMFDLMEQGQEVADQPDARNLTTSQVSIELDHVDFGYEGNCQILFDLSLAIPAGKTQIGRATGRERVWETVEIQEVAGPFKKKQR